MTKNVIEYVKSPATGTRLTISERALFWFVVLVISIFAIAFGGDVPGMLKLLLGHFR